MYFSVKREMSINGNYGKTHPAKVKVVKEETCEVTFSVELPKEEVEKETAHVLPEYPVAAPHFPGFRTGKRKDKRFWVPGFGTFTVRRRKARPGYNPRTKTAMTIPAARTVGFRPAPQLRKGL